MKQRVIMDDVGGMWDLVQYRLDIAREDLVGAKINFEQVSVDFCINIPFDKPFDLINLTYNPFICLEFNFTKLFDRDIFEPKESRQTSRTIKSFCMRCVVQLN